MLEFGPGGGFNAIATSTYKPSSYYFVEGSVLGVEQLKYFEKQGKIKADEMKIFESNFLDFKIDKKFDLVHDLINNLKYLLENEKISIPDEMTELTLLDIKKLLETVD